jgi:tRNA threonylcarbamoyladenosine biosynthesis protein TsaE
MRIVLASPTAEDTRAIGAALAPLLEAGDGVALTGELGAGKTTFTQGVALGLGVTAAVVSPTFTLVREYRGRLLLHHADVYRLDRMQDVLDLGFEEMTDEEGVLLVEWGDAVEGLLPADHLVVELTVPDAGDERRLVLTGIGSTWAMRWERLEHVLSGWEAAA